MNVNLTNISTEQRNPNTVDIDCLSTLDILKKINHEDKQVAPSIEKALPEIAKVVDRAAERLAAGEGLFISGPEPAAVSECWIRWNARRLSGSVPKPSSA